MMKKNEECLPLEYLRHEYDVFEYPIIERTKSQNVNISKPYKLLVDEWDGTDPDNLLLAGIAGNLNRYYPYTYRLLTAEIKRQKTHEKSSELARKSSELARKLFYYLTLLKKWEQNKIIYSLDKDFGNDLMNTENLRIRPEDISHLPFNCFYVDLSNTDIAASGVFTEIFPMSEKYFYVFVYAIGLNAKGIYPYTISTDNAGSCSVDLPENKLVDGEYWDITKNIIRNAEGAVLSLNNVLFLVFQFIAYITSKEPDIAENEVTKRTYRPSSTIKNKFSEVRQWDVGVRYGKTIRLNQQSENQNNTPAPAYSTDHNGTPKRPHMRCAHWCHYHTGKGRKNTICKWIAPIFVTGKSRAENQDFPAVIHQVTK